MAVKKTNLVGLVVVLWVVLEDLRLLLVIKVANKVIEPKVIPPLLTIDEPILNVSASSEEAEKGRFYDQYKYTFAPKVER